MRITRFAASLSIALAAAPILIAATRPTPLAAAVSSTSAVTAAASSLLNGTSPFALVRGHVTARTSAKRFTLSVTIGGANNVPAYSTGYLYTSVSGGTAPYTYCWYRDDLWTSCGSYSGQNPYFTYPGTEYFRVEVTDANGQFASSANFFVHIY
jgi:hypothetical protein